MMLKKRSKEQSGYLKKSIKAGRPRGSGKNQETGDTLGYGIFGY